MCRKFAGTTKGPYLCITVKAKIRERSLKRHNTNSRIGLIGRLINYNQKTENASLSNGGLRPSG